MGGPTAVGPATPAPLPSDVSRPRAGSELRVTFDRAVAKPAPARAAGRVVGALFVLALAVLAATSAFPAVVRALRRRGEDGSDRAQSLLAFAVAGLPPNRIDWAQAMLAELDQLAERRERWRFSLGCAWAAVRIRLLSREPGGALLRLVVFGCAAMALGLVGYGLVRYPGLRSEANFWGAMVVFLVTLLAYGALTVLLSRGATQGPAVARRYGLGGGVTVGAGWLLGIAPPALKELVFVPLLIALVGPAVVAVVAGRRARNARTGTLAALWSGLVGGLIVFIVWVTVTYANAGGPYDAGLVRDFHESGAHDLSTYAVSDDLGSGLVLLLMIPTVALALGSLSARVSAR